MKICVFGLGYVGTVTAACLADLGHEVIGVDTNPEKVNAVQAGKSPVWEPGLDELVAGATAAGTFRAVIDGAEAVADSQASLVTVGTPSEGYSGPDLSFVRRVCEDIGKALKIARGRHVVILRSTMLPGSMENIVIPALEAASGLSAGEDFGVCFNPEFLREGSAIRDFRLPPFTLIGEFDRAAARVCAEIYRNLDSNPLIVPLKTAEMVKFACNAFHALKVAFANEIGCLCRRDGIDAGSVMDIFCRDGDLNLGASYLKPGFAFGGSCLPKDLRSLLHFGQTLGLSLPVLEAILPSNEQRIQAGKKLILETGRIKVGLLGISFKSGTDDLRESPLVKLVRALLEAGLQVRIYDRNVIPSRLMGANRTYIEEILPDFKTMVLSSEHELMEFSEVIILGRSELEFAEITANARPDQIIIDLEAMTRRRGKSAVEG